MWICPNCSAELSDKDVSICGACGKRISAAEEVEGISDDYGASETGPAKYWSEEQAGDAYGEDEADTSPPRYGSDEAVFEEDDTGNGGEGQPEANTIPEDLSSLTQKLGSMMENSFDPVAKEIVPLRRFETENQALMVKGLLDCEGIMTMNSYNVLYVRQDDLETARELIGPDDLGE